MEISSSTVGTYTYDSQNRRTKKAAGGNSGNLIREYMYLNDEPLAQIDAGTPEVLTYLHTDHLGIKGVRLN